MRRALSLMAERLVNLRDFQHGVQADCFGPRLAAHGFDPQLAEFQIPRAVLNGFITLDIPVTEAV